METQFQDVNELVRLKLVDDYIDLVAYLVHYKSPPVYATKQEWDDHRKLCKAYRKVLRLYSTVVQFNRLPKLPKDVK